MIRNKVIFLLIILTGVILRIYKLDSIPPSLYGDEVSLGYNAYSILKTGQDEHGEYFPAARFIAFGDFKPPGYIYATVPWIAIWGLTEFAVRFASSLAGVMMIIITYYLGKTLTKSTKMALLSSLMVSLSPWSLQLSRGAFEANLAAAFNALAVLLFLNASEKRNWLVVPCVVLFLFSFYTFNANRIIAPLLFFSLVLTNIQIIKTNYKWLIISAMLAAVIIYPSVTYLRSRESKIRFQEVSIFNNIKTLEKSNSRIEASGQSTLGRLLHNRRIEYSRDFLIHYFDHFKIDYLFFKGDINPRLSTQTVGLLYLVVLPFFFIGILALIKDKGFATLPLFLWLAIAIIPASVAKETPHALRTTSIMPLYDIFVGFGIFRFYQLIEKHKFYTLLIIVFSFSLVGNMYYYLHTYYVHYPVKWASEWQYGYKEAMDIAKQYEDEYDYVLVSETLGRAYVYSLFYGKVEPKYYIENRIADRDWFGFWSVKGYGKYRFGIEQKNALPGKVLVIGNPSETTNLTKHIASVYNPNGEIVFNIGER